MSKIMCFKIKRLKAVRLKGLNVLELFNTEIKIESQIYKCTF